MAYRALLRTMSIGLLLVLASCGGAETADTADQSSPATEAEMAVFCEKYETVREQSWSEMTAALIDVSPDEIKVAMVRTSEPPGETWAEDLDAVEKFLERCDNR